jgi:asparagine synthase (glutamine-hydrolysing)
MVADIRKLPPGHLATFEERDLRVHRYWASVFADVRRSIPDPIACDAFGRLLEEAIASRMAGNDDAVGALLSGGLNSSLVVALAARSAARSLRTFTVGFEGAVDSRRLAAARLVARRVGSHHSEIVIRRAGAQDVLPRLIWHLDEPVADERVVGAYLVRQAVAPHVRAIVSGDGGDEVFGGHPRYAWFRFATILRERAAGLAALGRTVMAVLTERSALGRQGRLLFEDLTPTERHLRWTGAFEPEWRMSVLGPLLRSGKRPSGVETRIANQLDHGSGSIVHRLMALDLGLSVPDRNLVVFDRMSAAHSLEAHAPLLDHRLVETLGVLPEGFKVRGLRTKVLLRLIAERLLPREIVTDPGAADPLPADDWFRDPLDPMVQELLAAKVLRDQGYFDPEQVNRMLQTHRSGRLNLHRALWALLIFQAWHAVFIDRTLHP